MRLFHLPVYDDRINGTNIVYTPASLNDILGQPDSFHLFIAAFQTQGSSPTLSVDVQTSPDQITWFLLWNLVSSQSLNVGSTTYVQAFSTSLSQGGAFPPPLYPSYYARLAFSLGGTSPSTLLRAWVTARADLVLAPERWAATTAPPNALKAT